MDKNSIKIADERMNKDDTGKKNNAGYRNLHEHADRFGNGDE
jgi:hypothetical protein